MVTLHTKTRLKESLKLFNHINSFLFEQEFEELKHFSTIQRNKIKEAAKTLLQVIDK